MRSPTKRPTKLCLLCAGNCGRAIPAICLAPQQARNGTLTWMPVCSDHADSWWEGSDMEPIAFQPIPRLLPRGVLRSAKRRQRLQGEGAGS
jgi:hypothetical protein